MKRQDFLTIAEAAVEFEVPYMRCYMALNRLDARRVGASWLVRRSAVKRWVAGRRKRRDKRMASAIT